MKRNIIFNLSLISSAFAKYVRRVSLIGRNGINTISVMLLITSHKSQRLQKRMLIKIKLVIFAL